MVGVLFAAVLMAGPAPAKMKVFIDAGHGAPGNHGNRGVECQMEEDHTRVVAQSLAASLSAHGFEVLQSRTFDHPYYPARLATAEQWKADVIISIHSDARGDATVREALTDGGVCAQNPEDPGFAVLFSDEGPATLKASRAHLGSAVNRELLTAGFTRYDGNDYGSLYRPAEGDAGWIDIRPVKLRVFMLRKPTMPSIIIETHHALDVNEVAEWKKPETLERFNQAVERALRSL